MRTEHTQRSKFDRALEALEDLAAALQLSDAERVALERRLLAGMSVPAERDDVVHLRT